jgi:hypothetical protein
MTTREGSAASPAATAPARTTRATSVTMRSAAIVADLTKRTDDLQRARLDVVYRRRDRVFSWLMGVQWAAAILLALWISPWGWQGKLRTPGIPDTIREKVFDPFFTTKEVGKGSGQGLAIARSVVVDKHKGSLTFTRTAGRGTTFAIRLPLAAADAADPSAA